MTFNALKICAFHLIAASALCLCAACAGDKKPTAKEQAVKQWNDARATVMLGLARDQYNAGHFDKARETLNQALSLEPGSCPGHVLSAKVYIEDGELEAAESELTVARQLDPKNAEADYLSGVVYQRWQQPDKALEFYDQACQKAPAELPYLMAKSEMLVAAGRRDQALSLLQEKVVYFEHSPEIRDAVGLLLMQQGHYDQAVEMLRRASILAADDLTIREHLATALYGHQEFAECTRVLSGLIDQLHYQQRADLLMMLGECQMQTGDAGSALGNFQLAGQLMPNLSGIWVCMAKAQLQLNQLRPAEISLRREMAAHPDSSQLQLLLGYLRLRQSKPEEALAAFQRADRLAADDPTTVCMIGYSLEKLGRHEQAREQFARALKLSPGDPLAAELMAGVD